MLNTKNHSYLPNLTDEQRAQVKDLGRLRVVAVLNVKDARWFADAVNQLFEKYKEENPNLLFDSEIEVDVVDRHIFIKK